MIGEKRAIMKLNTLSPGADFLAGEDCHAKGRGRGGVGVCEGVAKWKSPCHPLPEGEPLRAAF